MWTPGNDVQCKQTTDCIIGLSKQDFSTVINGLSAIIVKLIQVSVKNSCVYICVYTV